MDRMTYNKAWAVAYSRDRARGRPRYVAAHETRARLMDLVDADVPLRAIAQATGLSDTAVGHLVAGRRELVHRHTAELVADLSLADVFDRASGNVPSIGATRRIQALMAIGWRKADLEVAGVPAAQLVTRTRARVSVQGWRRTREVYERLSMTPGPSQTCRDRARARGYAPPLAWDEDAIDDPRSAPHVDSATPALVDPVAVDRVVATASAHLGCDTRLRLTPQERVAATQELAARGSSDAEIAHALGVSDRTVLRLRHRHDIAPGVASSHVSPVPSTGRIVDADPAGAARLARVTQLEKAAVPGPGPGGGTAARAVGT